MKSRALALILALPLSVAPIAHAAQTVPDERLCKPVVPQVIVDLGSDEVTAGGFGLFISYDEEGGLPFSRETFSRSPRHTSCTTTSRECIASRARYEIRLDGPRYQSFRIMTMNMTRGDTTNRLVGGVRWHGPSYPDRVLIACDVNNLDPRTACRLQGVEYTANPTTSGRGGQSPVGMTRHDQCNPRTESTLT